MRSARMIFPILFLLGAWPALLLGALQALAQTPPSPPSPLFGEEIEVRVVNVEVVVTDRQGNRVPDLKPSDFRLLVDGKETPIEYFTEVRGGLAVAPTADGEAPVVPGLASFAPGSPVGTSYLVFVDDFFSLGPQRNTVLRTLQEDLGRLGPEDRMAIVAYDGRDLAMLSSWSSSQRDLSRAFQQAMDRPTQGIDRLADLRTFESFHRTSAGSVGPRSPLVATLTFEERDFARRLSEQIQQVVSAAANTLRGFASPPGRKVLLLLSGGWPYRVADYVVNDPSRTIMTREVPEGQELLRPLTQTANLLGYTLYSVDVPGVEGVLGADAENQGPGSTSFNLREQEIHDTLDFVARETGGQAFLGGRRGKALELAESDTRSYYWLGFTPNRQRNDARHAMRVEVRRPGLAVRSRDSFLDLSRQAEVSMMVESAMLFGSFPGAAPMKMQVGPPVKSGRREMVVPITLQIPMDAFEVVHMEGRYVARLELRVAATDEKGGRSPIPVIPIDLAGDKPPAPGSVFRYETRLTLRRAPHHLVVALFDPISGKITTAEADVKPGK
ncbi:MAG TPA: VWA domain-containing protein [Thermoanaerobaculia bacterium]|nr:VWA domain-containing protein [Thermoanaerobaculia bacterium]